MKWFQTASMCLLLVLTGCATTSDNTSRWVYPPMAVPLQPSVQQEVQIARLSQLLQRPDLNDEVRAKMLFERGNYYDSVGLRDLARLDFNQSLSLNPAQPDIFNLLGVYFTQVGEFDAAYESFDSTLELDPANSYAERNRSIALYYGERYDLANEEMMKHYADDPSDPFRALWLYIIQHELTPEQAKLDLQKRYESRDEQWGWVLVAIMLDDITEEQAFKAILTGTRDNTLLAQRLTETYFYLAKRHHMNGDYANAISLYKLAVSFNVYGYVEHRYSFLELSRIFTTLKAEHLAQVKLAEAEEEANAK
ncbi:lipoprotein NlpI [Vibrio splendidus]|uniref:lipoprotein NlpI n=1 Tax=Vibrio splendidus TaxID=29497 RepID=UPI000C84D8DF|nr:lipoprotein NlpI [Vibrio splendidus]PMM10761.1 lipoprotein NlpI [Vibrio splendidus]PMN22355.1 lipoprotein NlpI [Vibrio splendidus]